MTTASSPVKVDASTDEPIPHAAHFLGKSKKDVVNAAVRECIDAHRDEINAGVRRPESNRRSPSAVPLLMETVRLWINRASRYLHLSK